KALSHAGHPADVVTVSVGQGHAAKLLANLLGHRRDLGRGRGHGAVDQREAIVLDDQVAIHRKNGRIPGQLHEPGSVSRDLHSSTMATKFVLPDMPTDPADVISSISRAVA